jgi:hypothetical protein
MSRGPGSRQWHILQACTLASELHPDDRSRWWVDLRSMLVPGSPRSDWVSLQRAARRLAVTGGRYYGQRHIEYRSGRRGSFVRLKPSAEQEALSQRRERELQRRLAALRDLSLTRPRAS